MKSDEGLILILLGASGAGKTTVSKYIAKNYLYKLPDVYTTRVPRPNENKEKNIFFINNEDFDKRNFMIRYTCHGNKYGIANEIFEAYSKGERIIVGVSRKLIPIIKEKFSKVITVFIDTEIDILSKRIIIRDPSINRDDYLERIEKSKEMNKWARNNSSGINYTISNNGNIRELYLQIDRLMGDI